jgi:hypothetical protein
MAYSNAQVAHMWAHNTKTHARGSNLFFEGNVIYSYGRHFPIARLIPGFVLFTTRGYSQTTSIHISIVRQAVSHMPIVYVNDPCASPSESRREAQRAIERELSNSNKPRIRESTRLGHKARALNLANQFNAYIDAIGENQDLKFDVSQFENLRKELEELARIAAERKAAQEAKRMEEMRETIEKWRIGEYHGYIHVGAPLLRLNGENVETSKGAKIPVCDARKLWPIVEACRTGSREFTPGMPLGDYRLTKIRGDGSIVVGCHDIGYSEIAAIAAQLGL